MAEELNAPENTVEGLSSMNRFIGPTQIGGKEAQPIPVVNSLNQIPGAKPVSNPTYNAKDYTVGSTPYYPSKVAPTRDGNTGDKGKAIGQSALARINALQDEHTYNKIYAYDSSPKGAHKARYKAYGQSTYDKIGFSPEIDNEAWFNANTSQFDDWKRMATNAAWPMMKLGFMSPIKSYADLFGKSDVGADLQEARDYEEYNAIGYSTKGGVGGFLTNLQNSAAYSVGIMTEAVVEGAVIGGAIGFVEGGAGAVPGAALGGATGLVRGLAALPKSLFQMSKSLGKMTMNLKNLSKFSEAKNVFMNAGKTMGNFINPLENTTNAVMHNVLKNPDDLSSLARAARTAGAFWHDVKNINMALAEGRLEGGFTENAVYRKLYDDYYATYGVAPSDKLQEQMREQSRVAGFSNTFKNTALIYYTNKIAFPSVTRAGFLKGLPRFSSTLGKIGSEYNLVFNPGKTVAEGLYTAEKVSLRNSAKALTKPSVWGKTAFNYFKANVSEGLQEVSQDILSKATEDYYTNSFQNKDLQNFAYSMATLHGAVNAEISHQGLESFASGFMMGSILQGPSKVKDFLSVGYNKYFKNKSNYDEYVAQRKEAAESIVDALNNMHKNGKNFFDPRMNNYSTQMLVGKMADSPEDHSTKEFKDAEFSGFMSSVLTSLRTGTFDSFVKNFEEYKQLSPKELEDAWSLEPGQGQKALEGIDKAIENAKTLATRYDFAKKKFKNVVNISDYKEGTPEFQQATIYNEAYSAAVNNFVFLSSAFDNNLHRLNKLYDQISSLPTLQNSKFSNIANLVEPERLNQEISMLKTELSLTEQSDVPGAKKEAKKQRAQLEALTAYKEAQKGISLFKKELSKAYSQLIKEQSNLSNEELHNKALDTVASKYQEDPFKIYQDAVSNLLNTLAGSEENKLKLNQELNSVGGIDSIIESLMDIHALKDENINLAKHVNILNDPKGFYEHVGRNFEWMKKLYDNRADYYKEVVNNSLSAIEKNSLLEELANEGIYVDLEQFADWVEDNDKLPEYFIDAVNDRIIDKNSSLYAQYAEKFYEATELQKVNPAGTKSTEEEKLQAKINEVEEQRDNALADAKTQYNKELKNEIGFTEEEYTQKIYNEAFQNSSEASELNVQKEKLTNTIKHIDSKNPVEVQAVLETLFDEGFITEENFKTLADTVLDSEERLDDLTEVYNEYPEDAGTDEERQYAAMIKLVVKPLLVDELDKVKSKLDSISNVDDTAVKQSTAYNQYEKDIEAINNKFDQLINEVKTGFKKEKETAIVNNRTAAMQKSIDEVQELFSGLDELVKTDKYYIINGVPHNRMSNVIKSIYDTYTYGQKDSLLKVYDNTIGDKIKAGEELSLDLINDFIDELEDADLKGFSDFTYNELRDQLEALIPETVTTNIEAQKAAIERRRQVELSNLLVGKNIYVGNLVNRPPSKVEVISIELKSWHDQAPELSIKTKKDGFFYLKDITFKTEEGIKSREINAEYDAELAALQPTTISDKKANVKGTLAGQGTSIELEVVGETGKEFLLTVDRKGNISLWSEKQPDGSYRPGEGAPKESIDKLYNKYIPEKTRTAITNWLNAFTGSWAAPETEEGQNYEKAEKELNKELAALEQTDETNIVLKKQQTPSSKKAIANITSKLETVNKAIKENSDNSDKLEVLNKQKETLEKLLEEETGKTAVEATPENIESLILNTVKENTYEGSRVSGNYIDAQFRDLFDTESEGPVFDENYITKEAFDSLFGPEGYLTSIKKRVDAGEFHVFSKGLVVHSDTLADDEGNKLPPVAGELDAIFVDREGNKFIVDLKTGKPEKWANYNVYGTNSYGKKMENTLQQVGYQNLAQNRNGEQLEIKIFPIEITYNQATGKVLTANKPSTKSLLEDEISIGDKEGEAFTISLSRNTTLRVKDADTDTYKDTTAADLMQTIVPNKAHSLPKKEKKTKKVEYTENESIFVDKFITKLDNTNDITNLYFELNDAKPHLSAETYNLLKDQLDKKASFLIDNLGEVTIKSGEIYIFTEVYAKEKIKSGYKVKVNSIDLENNTVNVSKVGPGRKKSFDISISDFNNVTMSKEDVNNKSQEAVTYTPTQEEIENIEESQATVDDVLTEPAVREQWKKEIENSSLEDLKKDFFNNYKC